jgi:hypothetical protein
MFALAGIYSAFALFSLMGFFGCLARKRGLVLAYSWLSYLLLVLSIGVGILNIYHLFHKDNSKTIADCSKTIDSKTDTNFDATDKLCKTGTNVITTGVAIATTIVLVIYWLVTLCKFWSFVDDFFLNDLQMAATSFPPTSDNLRRRRMPRSARRHRPWLPRRELGPSPPTTPSMHPRMRTGMARLDKTRIEGCVSDSAI